MAYRIAIEPEFIAFMFGWAAYGFWPGCAGAGVALAIRIALILLKEFT